MFSWSCGKESETGKPIVIGTFNIACTIKSFQFNCAWYSLLADVVTTYKCDFRCSLYFVEQRVKCKNSFLNKKYSNVKYSMKILLMFIVPHTVEAVTSSYTVSRCILYNFVNV